MTRAKSSTKKTVTGDDSMGIKKLIGEAVSACGQGRPFAERLSAVTHKKIRSDFREVAIAKKAGKPIPTISAIVRFVESEYDVKMDRAIADRWFREAREELNVETKS